MSCSCDRVITGWGLFSIDADTRAWGVTTARALMDARTCPAASLHKVLSFLGGSRSMDAPYLPASSVMEMGSQNLTYIFPNRFFEQFSGLEHMPEIFGVLLPAFQFMNITAELGDPVIADKHRNKMQFVAGAFF